jgi:ATP-binding cassette subfamily F protein 3
MSILSTSNLGKSYDPVDIFSGISVSIPHRARIGLVGPNGVGKTTFLRVLLDIESPSEGSLQYAKNLTTGYLPQNAEFNSDNTLWIECQEPFKNLIQMRSELQQLEFEMAQGNLSDEMLEFYGKRQETFELAGGYIFENQIRQTLMGLGFTTEDEQRPMSQLSGGQRTRALLAKLLLSKPDLLLLDEPTNHLDIEAIEWLESYLKDWDGAVLIVSHDRYFLDQVVNTIWEMLPAMEVYKGDYSSYLVQRKERYERRLKEFKKQQEFIQKEEDFIRRNIAGQKTRQAQGRRKRLERLLKEAVLAPPVRTGRQMHFYLNASERSGDLVLRTKDLSIGYEDEGRPLFNAPDLLLKRKECAAIIGPNGAGKTTFFKTLLGQLAPLAGEVILGGSLNIGYFAQAHEDLHPELTLMEEIDALAPHMLPEEIRSYLARFLFTGEDVFKQVSTLSGGERGRLALACLALKGTNLLLLDEPTNHLDLPSQEVLQSMLADYEGTILLVSHDRYLIDALASQIWEVKKDCQELQIFQGTYSEYKSYLLNQETMKVNAEAEATDAARPSKSSSPKKNGATNKERQKLKQLDDLEEKVKELDLEMARISKLFENPPDDLNEVQKLSETYVRLQKEMDETLTAWTMLSEEIEG